MEREKIGKKIKSNKGFTMQDLAIAIVILLLFVGTIGGTYLAIYKVQSDTKLDSVATLYMIQMLEYINKIGYDEVTNGMEETLRAQFSIPNRFHIKLEISSYLPKSDSRDLVKKVNLTMNYTFQKQERNLLITTLKVKEL
jgi:uncharacterized protein YneF (UPF0154 family)